MVLRLYARTKFGLDLDAQVEKSFGAPPLLSESSRQDGSTPS